MDGRVKPGHDAEWVASGTHCVTARIQVSLHRSRCRFAARVVGLVALRKVRGRAGRRGSVGPTGLDVSRRRGLVLVVPQVRFLSSVPRAVFEACSASPPVDTLLLSTALDRCDPWPSERSYGIASKGP